MLYRTLQTWLIDLHCNHYTDLSYTLAKWLTWEIFVATEQDCMTWLHYLKIQWWLDLIFATVTCNVNFKTWEWLWLTYLAPLPHVTASPVPSKRSRLSVCMWACPCMHACMLVCVVVSRTNTLPNNWAAARLAPGQECHKALMYTWISKWFFFFFFPLHCRTCTQSTPPPPLCPRLSLTSSSSCLISSLVFVLCSHLSGHLGLPGVKRWLLWIKEFE